MQVSSRIAFLSTLLALITPAIALASSQTFNATGADQYFTVPAGITSVQVTAKGAGGGNISSTWRGSSSTQVGGAGGATNGTLAVTPGQILTVIVGKTDDGSHAATYGGGGLGGNAMVWSSGNVYCLSAAGGGRSAIRDAGSNELMTAGGGGGGTCLSTPYPQYGWGGGGGGLSGANGAQMLFPASTGGTQTAGGYDYGHWVPGSHFLGGGNVGFGSGGGGGWYGGGGGGDGGAGGGSGYCAGAGVSNCTTTTGAGAPSNTDGSVLICWGGSCGAPPPPPPSPQTLSCNITFDKNPINTGEATIARWTSALADVFYINSIGYVGVSGSANVAPSQTTDYSGTVYKCPAGTTLNAGRTKCVSGGGGGGGAGSQTFSATGADQYFTVPAGVTLIDVTLKGAGGGIGYGANHGGKGGLTTGTISVTPGQVLTVIVGKQGAVANNGGPFGGTGDPLSGGYGGGGNTGDYGTGGGGRSAIDTAGGTELITAGGAGGGGYGGPGVSGGGLQGDSTYESGVFGTTQSYGGTQTAAGYVSPGPMPASIAASGHNGGVGTIDAGGGGGGWYGGAGGFYAGGGGGSGYCGGAGVSACTTTTGAGSPSNTDGSVKITWSGGGGSSSAPQTATCPATLTVGTQCPAGQTWNGTQCVPSCPAGQVWNGTQCVNQCPAGQVWNGTQCVNQCPAGEYWNGTACVPIPACTGGRFWNGTACICPAGQTWNGTQCLAQCPAGQHRNAVNICVCSDDIAPVGGSCGASVQSFTVLPTLVRKGDTVKVSWSVLHALSCQVAGTNHDLWSALSRTDQVSGPITAQTIYTLSCVGLDNVSISQKKIVNIVPMFREI